MAKIGNTIVSLFVGAVAGVVVGYLLATDKETRKEDIEKLKQGLNSLKDRVAKKPKDMEEDIYHS